MAVEDFTTYAEVDADIKVTKTATRVSWAGAETRANTYYVYKDYLAGHFGNYSHTLTIYIDSMETRANVSFWIVANAVGDSKFLETDNDNQSIYIYGDNGNVSLWNEATNAEDTYDGNLDTLYYLTVSRSGTTGTCLVYSDSARTDLLDTLSVTVSSTTFRYVYGFAGYDNDITLGLATGYTENLDLNEAAGPANVKKIAGVSFASIKKVSGVAIASVKKVAGVN